MDTIRFLLTVPAVFFLVASLIGLADIAIYRMLGDKSIKPPPRELAKCLFGFALSVVVIYLLWGIR